MFQNMFQHMFQQQPLISNDVMKYSVGKKIARKSMESVMLTVSVTLLSLVLIKPTLAEDKIIEIVASIKPVQLLVNEITGVSESVKTPQAALLLEETQSHHLRSLSSSQRILVSNARYVFYISDEFEAYMQSVRRSDHSPKSVFKYIELGKQDGIRLLSVRQDGQMPQIYEPNTKLAREAQRKPQQGRYFQGASDPDWHIWLNPDNAIVMLGKIRDILQEIDPNQGKLYQRNYHNAVARITAQSERVAEKMMHIMKTPFLTLHDGYQYFEEQYGLKSVGSILRDDSETPSISRIAEVRELIENYNIRCVFKESRFSTKTIAPVLEGFDTQVVNLDGIGKVSDTQLQTYTDLIDQFAGVFYTSLITETLGIK